MTRAARYRRVSGETQEDNSSLETQLVRINAYCAQKGYLISSDTLYTEVMTGVVWRERPELQRALRETHKYEVLVIDITDRIGRGEPIIIVMEELRYHDKRLESVQDPIEDTDEGMLLLNIHAYTSKREWARIVKRTQDGRDAYIQAGNQLGTYPKYGYMWDADHTHYIPHPEERKIVERIFSLAKSGMTGRSIAKLLNDEGVPTRTGDDWRYSMVAHILADDPLAKQFTEGEQQKIISRIRQLAAEGVSIKEIVKLLNEESIPSFLPALWRHNHICQMLRDPIYKGQGKSLKTVYTRQGIKRVRSYRPVSEQIPIDVPALVEEETWDIVQKQIDYNKRTSPRNAKNPEASLLRNGVAYCGHCGGRMRSPTASNGSRTYYLCMRAKDKDAGCPAGPSITTTLIDEPVWKYACNIIRDPKKRQEVIDGLRSYTPEIHGEQGIAASKEKIEQELANTIEMGRTAKNKAALAKINWWIEHYEKELEILAEEEKKILAVKDQWSEVEAEIQRFLLWCETWVEKLDKATYQDKRTVLEYLGIKVLIFRFGHSPRFKIQSTPPNLLEKLGFVSISS